MNNLTKILLPTLAISFGIFTNCFAGYEQKITAFDGAADDSFGSSVSVDGNYAIVGSPEDDDGVNNSGSAYIYFKNGDSWILQQKITEVNPNSKGAFGSSVSINGDYAIIGAPKAASSGRAYIFKRNGTTWTQEESISASDGSIYDSFGNSVSIYGNYAVIGVNGDDDSGSNSGSAYIFYNDGTTWTEQAKLMASDGASGDNFGNAVTLSSNYAIIGAARSDVAGESESGSVYVFQRNGTNWTEQTKIIASDNSTQKFFGQSVSFDNDYLIVGAPQVFTFFGGNKNGKAYIFHRNGTTWTEQAKLSASDDILMNRFGQSVSISGNYAIVGAFQNDFNGNSEAGSAFTFSRSGNTWSQSSRIVASDVATDDNFGLSVGMSGNNLVVGAIGDDDLGSNSGSAYFYPATPFANGNVTKTISSDSTFSFEEGVSSNLLPDKETGIDITFSGVTNSAAIQCESFNRLPDSTNGIANTPQAVIWEITDNGLNFANAEIRIDINSLPVSFSLPETAIIYYRATSGSGNFAGLATSLEGDTLVANTNSFGEFTIGVGELPPINLQPNDLLAEDFFGTSVDVSGNYAIVGAPKKDHSFGANAGAAYIYFKNGTNWTQQAKLTANIPNVGNRFGGSVSIDGDYAIIGAERNGAGRGAAYIFHRTGTTWTQQAKLTANDAETYDHFGSSVSIDGNFVVIGAPEEGGFPTYQRYGAAYIFQRNGTSWTQVKKLTSYPRAHLEQYGYSVSIIGGTVAVGAPTNNDNASQSGAVYISTPYDFWNTQTKIVASDPSNYSWFGSSISISQDYAIVGAPRTDGFPGAAYIFKNNGNNSWSQQAKLTGNTLNNVRFGHSVNINGNYSIVGTSTAPGYSYIFGRSGTAWTERKILGTSSEGFGYSVGLCDENAIVGAYSDDNGGSNFGSVYFYNVNLTSLNDSFVNGDVSHTISSNTTVSFNEGSGNSVEDTGIDITFSGVTNSGTVTCESFLSPPTGTNGINGTVQSITWVITGGGLNFANAEIRIDLSTLPVTLADPSSAVIYHRSNPGSGTFTALPTTLIGNELVANTPSFSEFAVGGGDAPLFVEIESFNALQLESSIHLSWATASETNNEGFNLYRKMGESDYVKIASFKTHEELLGQGNTTGITNYKFVDDSEFLIGETYSYYISDVEFSGLETSHKDLEAEVSFVEANQIIRRFELEQNFPNPFNPSTSLKFQIAKDSKVSLKIYNVLGKEVRTLVNEFKVTGSYQTTWNGLNNQNKAVSTGIYFAKIQAGDFSKIIKMSLLK